MRRRDFISCMGSATVWPLAVRAQQLAMPVIGFLSSRSPGESANVVSAFRQGLRETGFVEGQNVLIAFRWAEGRYDQLAALAAELVDLRVAVLFAAGGGHHPLLPPKRRQRPFPWSFLPLTIPCDWVWLPGGNVTGMSLLTSEMVAKSTQLLKELVPTAAIIA
jgi:putative ABC transport system substrate-binding protein